MKSLLAKIYMFKLIKFLNQVIWDDDMMSRRQVTRRRLLKALLSAGIGLAFAPLVPSGAFLKPPVTGLEKRPVFITNVEDMSPGGFKDFYLNVTGNPAWNQFVLLFLEPLDGTIELNNLPLKDKIRAVRENGLLKAYSKVCVHLQCIIRSEPFLRKTSIEELMSSELVIQAYKDILGKLAPGQSSIETATLQCPCHGSTYDTRTGVAIAGPAALQSDRTLPEVKLKIDDNGDVFAVEVVGLIGIGRERPWRYKLGEA